MVIVFEAWRFLPHSYALWSQYMCLDLLDRPGVTLYHLDAPLADPRWAPARGVLDPDEEARLAAIPPPPGGLVPDVLVRLKFPYDFGPSPAKKTIVVATSEYGMVPDNFVLGGRNIGKAAKESGFTVVTCSEWARQGFLRSGVRANQLGYVRNGIDPAVFRPLPDAGREAARREFGWDGAFVLLHNSSLGWNKNIEGILEGLHAVLGEHPRVRLVIKGVDALWSSNAVVERLAGSLPADARERLLPHIEYIGASMPMRAVARLYQAADAYVCPYLAEGFNMPALEAAACGLPVLCTAGGSTEDFMRPEFALKIAGTRTPGPNGGVVLTPRPESFVAQLRRVIRDGAFRAQARAAGPAFAHAGWTWKHATDDLMRVIGAAAP